MIYFTERKRNRSDLRRNLQTRRFPQSRGKGIFILFLLVICCFVFPMNHFVCFLSLYNNFVRVKGTKISSKFKRLLFACNTLEIKCLDRIKPNISRKKPNPKISQKNLKNKYLKLCFFREIFHFKSPCWLTKLDLKHFKVLLNYEFPVKFLFILIK